MKAKYDSDNEWAADRMKYLIGCELTNVVVVREDGRDFTGLTFLSDSEHGRDWTVWVQSDPEGNDGGFLQLQANNEAAEEVMEEMQRDQEIARKAD